MLDILLLYEYNKKVANKGVWCNGNMPVSKTVLEGSSPSTPAKTKKHASGVFFCFDALKGENP